MSSGRIRKEVDEALFAFVDRQRPVLHAISDDLDPLVSALADLLAGGKRLRPAFCHWGWRGAGGADLPQIVPAAASLELLQAGALIHDDVMDASDTRRGRPSAHRRFQTMHESAGWPGTATAFGTSAAILLGDLCLAWSGQMYDESGLPGAALRRGRPVYDQMRAEVMSGQYLDIVEQARGRGTVESALRVVVFKSAKYTIERPLHLGAALVGAQPGVIASYTAYGMPLGIAFQLRDDVLGVFGDPAVTGKPAGDDLRRGKPTVLLSLAAPRLSGTAASTLRQAGSPTMSAQDVVVLQDAMVNAGVRTEMETLIAQHVAEAIACLNGGALHPSGVAGLTELTKALAWRTS